MSPDSIPLEGGCGLIDGGAEDSAESVSDEL